MQKLIKRYFIGKYLQTYFVATVHLQLHFYSQKTNTGDRRIAEVLRPRSYFTVSSYNFLKELNNIENVNGYSPLLGCPTCGTSWHGVTRLNKAIN